MNDEFINPNYHVVLVHVPLGLMTIGVLIELLAPLLWPRSGVRAAARWMVGLGALAMLPTAAAGMYALSDVVEPSPQADAFLELHAWLAGAATIVAPAAVVLWIALSDRWRRRAHWPLVGVIAVAALTSVVGAWFSGEAVYRHGTGVEAIGADAEREPDQETTPSDGVHPTSDTSIVASEPAIREPAEADKGASGTTTRSDDVRASHAGPQPATPQPGGVTIAGVPLSLRYFMPPLQGHALLAGLSAAFGFAGLGLSIRRLHAGAGDELTAIGRRLRTSRGRQNLEAMVAARDVDADTSRADSDDRDDGYAPPAARYWVIAMLLAVLTMAAGWWYLADDGGAWDVAVERVGPKAGVVDKVHATLRGMIVMVFEREPRTRLDFVSPRRVLHVVTGVVIVACLFTLAILARWSRRRALPLAVVSTILLAALAWQTWLGGLLLFEGPEGPVGRTARED